MTSREEIKEVVLEALSESKKKRKNIINRELVPMVNIGLIGAVCLIVITMGIIDTPFNSSDIAILATLVAATGTILGLVLWVINSYVATNQLLIEEIMKKLEIE